MQMFQRSPTKIAECIEGKIHLTEQKIRLNNLGDLNIWFRLSNIAVEYNIKTKIGFYSMNTIIYYSIDFLVLK